MAGWGGGQNPPTVTFQAWGTLPTSPSTNDRVHFTDIPLEIIYDGSNWQYHSGEYMYWFFYNEGKLTTSMSLVAGGRVTTFPTPDGTDLATNATHTIVDSVVECDWAANTGSIISYWNLSPASECLIIATVHSGDTTRDFVVGFCNTFASNTYDDAYYAYQASNAYGVAKENAGSSALDTCTALDNPDDPDGHAETIALYYKDSTGEITGYVARGPNSIPWQFATSTDSDFTTKAKAFVSIDDTAGNLFALYGLPFAIFEA